MLADQGLHFRQDFVLITHAGLPSVGLVAIVSLAALVCLTATNTGQVPYIQWYSLHATPAAPARGLHGRVHKAGPIDLKRFYSKLGVDSCYDERRRWAAMAAARRNLTQSELADLRLTPCAM